MAMDVRVPTELGQGEVQPTSSDSDGLVELEDLEPECRESSDGALEGDTIQGVIRYGPAEVNIFRKNVRGLKDGLTNEYGIPSSMFGRLRNERTKPCLRSNGECKAAGVKKMRESRTKIRSCIR